MIKHEEALETKKRIVRVADDGVGIQYAMYGVNYSASDAKNDCELLDKYIAQQKKQEEKYEKLIKLYWTKSELVEMYNIADDQFERQQAMFAIEGNEKEIKQLESELEL